MTRYRFITWFFRVLFWMATSLLPSLPISAWAAPQDLDELNMRKSRLPDIIPQDTLDNMLLGWQKTLMPILENEKNHYYWQPETLNYYDTNTNAEVWKMTNTPLGAHYTQDISASHWSADGNRVMFHSNRPTALFSRPCRGARIWMITNSDGSQLRPANGAANRNSDWDVYVMWSPLLRDTFYQVGTNDCLSGILHGDFYRNVVSDNIVTRNLLFSLPGGTTRTTVKNGISGDGKKVILYENRYPNLLDSRFHVGTVYPTAGYNATYSANGRRTNALNLDFYWGNSGTGDLPRCGGNNWCGYHANFLSGAETGADGVWHYIMPDNTNGSWWRTRLTGSGENGAPRHRSSRTPPYQWGGQVEPVNTVTNGTRDPWCTENPPDTECMDYPSHFASD